MAGIVLPPSRIPPPLPSRIPVRSAFDPYAIGRQFDRPEEGGRVSTRDVQRASGSTYNQWIATNSTNVNRMRYDPDIDPHTGGNLGHGTITIEFLDLSMYKYPGRSVADWLDLFESSSKGRFAYYQIRGAGPSRKG